MSLKEKTVSGIFWSAVDSFANYGIHFIVGIVLARLITPKEFGLVGMITIFISISTTFIHSGFSSALIRKNDCTQEDYSTVFFYNIIMGTVLYLLIYFSAVPISNFYGEPELVWILRVLSLSLFLRSLTLIQTTTLTKRIDFKLQARIVIISGVLSGVIGIVMALYGFGVWSLVGRALSGSLIRSSLLWIWNRWMPSLIFSKKSFKELFGFGSKILISSLIDTVYSNIYYLVIGKYFSAEQLGYYSRAQSFANMPSSSLNNIMTRVTFPVLANMQDNKYQLKAGYKKLITNLMFMSMVILVLMAAIAEPLVVTLIGEKWRQSIIYLQLLCFPAMLFPLQQLNLNMLKVLGRSDLVLRVGIIKKVLAVPFIVLGVLYGIEVLILGMWANALISYYFNSYYSGRLINYSIKEQLSDILPYLLFALTVGAIVFVAGWQLPVGYLVKLLLQIALGILLVLGLGKLLQLAPYMEIRTIALDKIKSIRDARRSDR
ncbi:MAG: lipopolysaccharide biosynthesis protein [Bacteroidales bacterium]|nr:lipopolysaccharide biosynthesis protein [Bacteroidales bacterium]